MVSYGEHLKKILSQTVESYYILKEIQDKPGDLDIIKKEMLKINGFLKVVTNNIDEYKIMSMQTHNIEEPSIIFTGDLNATPFSEDYPNLTYTVIKQQRNGMYRSIYNDDFSTVKSGEPVWSTWKARNRGEGVEKVVKHCIDYIFYMQNFTADGIGVTPRAVLDVIEEKNMDAELLPGPNYPSDHLAMVADFSIVILKTN